MKTSSKAKTSDRKLNLGALVDYKKGNLGSFMLAIFYLVFPWFTSGVLDPIMAIFGLMFLTISIMRAKPSNTVIAGLCQAFIAVIYVFSIAGILDVTFFWTVTIILAAIFFIMELGFFKFGPVTSKADAFQIVPFTLLSFGLLMSFVGYTTLFIIDWINMLVALNYVAVLCFCMLSMFQIAGWQVMGKKHTNLWITIFAVAAIAFAVFGVYQGTLFQWRG